MNKENSFTPDQLMDMVKSITSNARIGQFIVENHGTVNYNEKEAAPPDDRHMRQVLQELLVAKDENGDKLMVEQQQWFAVFRVLVEYGNYPRQMSDFARAMAQLGMDRATPACKHDSLRKASQTFPRLACKVSQWQQYCSLSEAYAKQCKVADWLIKRMV